MNNLRVHMILSFTITIFLIGFFVFLSPPLVELRSIIGLPTHLPGSRYNPDINAAEIINPSFEEAKNYLGRVTLVYHAVFAALLYATLIIFNKLYFRNNHLSNVINNISFVGAVMTISGAVIYSYLYKDFFWHGVFVGGLATLFVAGLIILINFKPKNLLELNIWVTGILLMIGGLIGGWLGSSFMEYRHDFLEALISSRFNPDLGEENIFWRALTAHEHAMIALALVLIFLIGVSIVGIKKSRFSKALLYIILFGEFFMASASYAVWPVGKIAHLIITPAAISLIFGTLLLSFKTEISNVLSWGLKIGNIIIWAGVAVPGGLVAISLRKPILFNPAFRDQLWDWAELAFNIGHWHILLVTWGIILLLIYITWPENMGRITEILGKTTLIGYAVAMLSINLYMLGNGPGQYIPNPYNNIWLSYLVEPSLALMSVGIGLLYLLFLRHTLIKIKNSGI